MALRWWSVDQACGSTSPWRHEGYEEAFQPWLCHHHPSQDRNQSGEQEADQEGHREQQPCRQKPIRDEDQGQQEADEKGRIQSRSPIRHESHESHESEEDRLETEEAGEAEEAGQEVGPCFYWLGPG